MAYPHYRLFCAVQRRACSSACGSWCSYTRLGALIRAGVDDAEMVDALGIDIRRVFVYTFMLGAALAGIGGVLGGAFLSLYPTADSDILVYSLAVVIIGGRGSLAGAAIGSLLVGMLATFGQVWFPELAYFVIFGPMALLLAFRPLGLFGPRRMKTRAMTSRARTGIALACLALLAAVPFVIPGYKTSLVVEMLIFATLAMSIDFLAGFAGRTSLCHGAIFGDRHLRRALLRDGRRRLPWIGVLLGVAAATVGGGDLRLARRSDVGRLFPAAHARAGHDRMGRVPSVDIGDRRRKRPARRRPRRHGWRRRRCSISSS